MEHRTDAEHHEYHALIAGIDESIRVHAMKQRTDAEYHALLIGIDASIRAINAHEAAAGMSSLPTAARIPGTKKRKNRSDQSACSSLSSPAPENVRPRSSLRRASPEGSVGSASSEGSLGSASSERRRSPTGISWNKDIAVVCIIPAGAPEEDPFMALMQGRRPFGHPRSHLSTSWQAPRVPPQPHGWG